MRLVLAMSIMALVVGERLSAAVDTLRDTSDVVDAVIYSWSDCNPETVGEDCRRYNGGRVVNMGVGNQGFDLERRIVVSLPGWDGTVPDSSHFLIYCYTQLNSTPRNILMYPLTSPFLEGNESAYGLGDYPDPDSGATWMHRYLDYGQADSASWETPGGDYTTSVGCTTLVDKTGRYFAFREFNRILEYWDSTGHSYGFILINENLFPSGTSNKVIKSSEAGQYYWPMVLMFHSDSSTAVPVRRKHACGQLF